MEIWYVSWTKKRITSFCHEYKRTIKWFQTVFCSLSLSFSLIELKVVLKWTRLNVWLNYTCLLDAFISIFNWEIVLILLPLKLNKMYRSRRESIWIIALDHTCVLRNQTKWSLFCISSIASNFICWSINSIDWLYKSGRRENRT